MIRKKITESQFQRIKPSLRLSDTYGMTFVDKHGQVNLLVSGTIDTCTGLATPGGEYRIVGATINYTTYDLQGNAVNNRDTLKQCTQFSLTLPNLETGETDYYLVDIAARKVFVDYIYLRCDAKISASNISFGENSIIDIDFGNTGWTLEDCKRDDSSTSDDSRGKYLYDYKAYLPNLYDIQYFPYYTTDYFKDDYNPSINNATSSRQNSSTVTVGMLSSSIGFFDREGMGRSEIPDSWYTSLGIGLGRYLGTKCTRNLICEPYVGFKKSFTDSYLSASKANFYTESGSTKHRSVDRPFYSVQTFSGSVFVSGSIPEKLSAEQLSSVSPESLYFSADSRYTEETDSWGDVTKAWVKVGTLKTVPSKGDVIYRVDEGSNNRYRLTDGIVYIPELGKALRTDGYGVIQEEIEVV